MSTYDGNGGPAPFAGSAQRIVSDFDMGEVLGTTFSIAFGRFGSFALPVALVLLPAAVCRVSAAVMMVPGEPALLPAVLQIVGVLAGVILGQLATAAVVFGVFQYLRGRPVTFQECLAKGLRLILRVFAVGIVVGLLTALGMLVFCIPGFVALAAFAVAVPAAVIEGTGVGASISRSVELTTGHKWRIFGLLFGVGLLTGLLSLVIAMPLNEHPLAAALLTEGLTIVSTVVSATLASLIYYRLRQIKESVTDVEAIASVFD